MSLVLGIDTSNYTTSAAIFDGREIIENSRILLSVKSGEKGLRQSDALYQHWTNLPLILEPLLKNYRSDIGLICVSSRPRPIEGSYMPVFNAGLSSARIISSSLGVPLKETSHQEGHFAAAAFGNDIDFSNPFIAAHLSGGTLELIYISKDKFEIVGGTKDISYGQLLDRIGVDLGFDFPAGKSIDELACSYSPEGLKNPISRIFTDGSFTNLSGVETQLKRTENSFAKEELAFFLMERLSESFVKITENAKKNYGADQVLVSGGVACSLFFRNYCSPYNYKFGKPELCADNAAGAALIGGGLWL